MNKSSESRAATGIPGFDELTRGGLPRGRATVISGSAGSGKTVASLQMLVHGALECDEPGIFVAFEETAERIVANASSFGWNLPALAEQKLFFLDAQPDSRIVQTGSFDLDGLLAALDSRIEAMGARRLVLDAIDVVLELLDDPASARQQVYRLHDWLLERDLTTVITNKARRADRDDRRADFIEFMVDCAVELEHRLREGVAHRSLRVVKLRGSGFDEDAAPFVIGDAGIEVARTRAHADARAPVITERVSSGIERLDTMLGGGHFRGASILVTGAPGTAKTTLAGAFSNAACQRSERVLYISFDSRGDEMVRNLRSVSIDLQPHIDAGLLLIDTARSISGSAEVHLMHIQRLALRHGARTLVIDPVSALAKQGNSVFAHSAVERLIDWAKCSGLTVFCTSLFDPRRAALETTPLQISTIADTWINLGYHEQAGERNRSLSIVKARGTGHSAQVRELLLSGDGISLADVYSAGGQVLMGTLRYEKERELLAERERKTGERARRSAELKAETADLQGRIAALEAELEVRRVEVEALETAEAREGERRLATHAGIARSRGRDLHARTDREKNGSGEANDGQRCNEQ